MTIYCIKCGSQLPDDAKFCLKCGAPIASVAGVPSTSSTMPPGAQTTSTSSRQVIAPSGATTMKCPSCGAPIAPKFGEMVITCEYCGSAVTLASGGWTSIQKQTMLPLKIPSKDDITAKIHSLMDHGLLHRHLQENSTLEEMSLTYVPYWIISVSARTSVVAIDTAAEVGTIATEAALLGAIAGMAGGGGNRGGMGFGGGMLEGAALGTMMGGGGMMNPQGTKRTFQLDANYNFPVVALKSLTDYQPKDYQFALDERTFFDITKVPKGIKVLNGDVGEDAARYQAKTLVDQLQSQKAHEKYHMIQQINTEVDLSEAELMHAPVWFARYAHKNNKIVLVIDANSGATINSIGL
ncbi:MAG TPA: zinc ribbon domain-containing protein [Nitrososphaerales archaeon]|nr:zinc ribbon domain-containing protein [Nitrososphaerales archaeon]